MSFLKCIILHVMPRVRKNRIVLSFLQTNLCFYQTFFLPHFPAKKLQRREGFTEIREKIKFQGICPVKIDHFVTKGLVQYHPELQYVSALDPCNKKTMHLSNTLLSQSAPNP